MFYPAPRPNFKYKLAWFKRLISYANKLLKAEKPVIIIRDFNVMPTQLKVYNHECRIDDALFRPEVRQAFKTLKI